jgi:hypothetical protein
MGIIHCYHQKVYERDFAVKRLRMNAVARHDLHPLVVVHITMQQPLFCCGAYGSSRLSI